MSGKSSLLAGLTGLSFPSSPVFRTRFATQVTLRNTPGEFPSVTAYIVPGRTSTMSGSTSNILVRSTSFISKTAFDSTDFPQILEKVGSGISRLIVHFNKVYRLQSKWNCFLKTLTRDSAMTCSWLTFQAPTTMICVLWICQAFLIVGIFN